MSDATSGVIGFFVGFLLMMTIALLHERDETRDRERYPFVQTVGQDGHVRVVCAQVLAQDSSVVGGP